MKEIISKELLSVVSENKCLYVKMEALTGKILYQYVTPVERIPWNIYELASKCKEWAYYEGYELNSSYSMPLCACLISRLDNIEIEDDNAIGVSEIESEAIFKACQWILDNRGNK